MSSQFVTYKNSSIHYLQHNGGDELLVCLHGFGETAECFSSLVHLLSKRFTVIAIDLPFHGKTTWNEGLNINIHDLVAIINCIPVLQQNRFSLMGFSMGGRVALYLYQHLPQRIQQLILLAPDGLKVNPWYWLATQSKPGNKLFRHFMKKPGLFFAGTRALNKLGLINMGVYNYVHQYLQMETKRQELYTIWTAMRGVRPDTRLVKILIQQHQTPVVLIYGAYDRIIRYETGNAFRGHIESYCTLHVLECGHRILQKKNADAIAALLLS